MPFYFHSLSNEEKFVLANDAARKVEEETGRKMTSGEYEEFVWDFIENFNKPKLQ